MHLIVQFLLLGLGSGAVYAALSMALVMTYRSSGVLNFSTGAVALYVAYTYSYLRQGRLLDPIPGLSTTVDLGGALGLFPAMVVSIVLGAVLGALLYLVIFRWLRTAPPAGRAVASIGLMVAVQGLLAAKVGTTPVSVAAILPAHLLHLGSILVPSDRLLFAATVVVLAAAVAAFFRFTRFGLATRAAAESEKGALLTGLSPERIAVANWALSTAVAGVSGILIAPIVPLIPVSYTLFIVPALAAALIGGFSNVSLSVAAGLVIGMLQSEGTYLQSTYSWLPSSGVPDLVPLVIIFVFLLARGRSLPERGSLLQQRLGRAPRPRAVLPTTVVSLAIGVILLLVLSGSYRAALMTSLVFGVITLSQVVVTGYAGQVSLAQLTLSGVGAFTLVRLQSQAHIPFPVAPIVAAVIAAAVGVLLGLPALRVRGIAVAVITLSLAVAVSNVWFDDSDFNGGSSGSAVSGPKLFGADLSIGRGADFPRLAFGFLALAVLGAVAVGVALLRRSTQGAAMLAVRANERSAAAAGIDVARTKVTAFAIGGFLAGLGGAMLAYAQLGATSASFEPLLALGVFATAYLAGVTSVSGGILAGLLAPGGLIFTVLDKALAIGNYYDAISGVLVVLVVVRNPEGIVGPVQALLARLRSSRRIETVPAAAPTDEPAVRRLRELDTGVVLSAASVEVRYGSVVAVSDVHLEVAGGTIVGLVGPNGAGKTTLIDALSGYAPCTGPVSLGGVQLTGTPPHRRSRAGLGRTFQAIELYDDLSVRENVEVGTAAARGRGGQKVPDGPAIDGLFRILGLDAVSERTVSELSQGQRQLVSVARALAGRPRVLLLDEPAGGLDSTESRWLGERLQAVRDAGVTIVMVDHDMGLVLGVCDRVVVLDLGRVIADGTPAEIARDPLVAQAYLGNAHAAASAEEIPQQPAEPTGPTGPTRRSGASA